MTSLAIQPQRASREIPKLEPIKVRCRQLDPAVWGFSSREEMEAAWGAQEEGGPAAQERDPEYEQWLADRASAEVDE